MNPEWIGFICFICGYYYYYCFYYCIVYWIRLFLLIISSSFYPFVIEFKISDLKYNCYWIYSTIYYFFYWIYYFLGYYRLWYNYSPKIISFYYYICFLIFTIYCFCFLLLKIFIISSLVNPSYCGGNINIFFDWSASFTFSICNFFYSYYLFPKPGILIYFFSLNKLN